MKQFFILFASATLNTFTYAQTKVEEPVRVKTTENGVQIYSTPGNENKQEAQSQSTPNPAPPAKTLNDYSVEEIDNILLGLNEKIQFLEGSNEIELINLMKAKRVELLDRRKVLTGAN